MSLHLDTNTPYSVSICVLKARHTRKSAKRLVWLMRKRMETGGCWKPAEGYRLHAYKCPVCDCWHIGNTKERL